MTTVGVCMVKDEADIIEHTVRRMLTQVDAILIADNNSTDGTRDILAKLSLEMPDRVDVVDDPEPGYYQSSKMSTLAHRAYIRHAASWVVPFDADEVWFSRWGRVADVLAKLPENEGIAPAVVFDHVTTDLDDTSEEDPTKRILWRRSASLPLPKVAVRPVAWVVIEQGNHGARYYDRSPNPVLEVRHFPYRSDEQFVSKVRNGAAAYAATDLPDTVGAHWRQYGAILRDSGPEVLVRDVYRRWFHEQRPRRAGLVLDPCP